MIDNTSHIKLVTSQVIMHTVCYTGLYMLWNPQWLWLSLVGIVLIAGYGIGLYCHRYLSHSSFNVHRGTKIVLNFLGIMGLQGSPMIWAANHANHHRYSDKEKDPHPAYEWFKTWFWVSVGKRLMIDPRTIKRLSKDPMHPLTTRYYFKIYWSTIILSAIIDPRVTVYFFAVPVVYAFHISAFTNIVLHKWGYRNFDTNDDSTNLPLPFLMESPYHNNHHNDPSNYNQAVKWYEFDMYKYLIDIIKVKGKQNG